MDDIWKTDGGLILGHSVDRLEGPPKPGNVLRYTGSGHCAIYGGPGSGKTRRWLLRNASMLTGWSMVLVDPKGLLLKLTAAHRAAMGSEIVVYDPFGKFSRGFNAIKLLDPKTDDFVDDAMGQAEGLIEVGDTREPHWPISFQEFQAALAMYVRLIIPNGSYVDTRVMAAQDEAGIRRLILGGVDLNRETYRRWKESRGSKEAMELFAAEHPGYNAPFEYKGALYPGMMMTGILHKWEQIGTKAHRFSSITPDNKELHSIISTGLTQTRSFDSPYMAREMSGPGYDYSQLKKRKITIYIVLPPRRLVTHGKYVRILLTSIVNAIMADEAQPIVPVAVVIDEAAAFGSLPVVQNNVALSREYGIKFITCWQYLSQAQKHYPDVWEGLGFGIAQTFAAKDVVGAEYFSKLSGQTTVETPSRGTSQNRQAGSPISMGDSYNLSKIQVPMLLPQDIRNMDPGYTILYSDKAKGYVRSYLPYPTQIPELHEIMKLDPSA